MILIESFCTEVWESSLKIVTVDVVIVVGHALSRQRRHSLSSHLPCVSITSSAGAFSAGAFSAVACSAGASSASRFER